jgi:photosystem II stability/assembly factor-like uncharacterized protein
MRPRASVALYALSLAACGNLLGLHDIVPDGEPVELSFLAEYRGVAEEPLGLVTVMAVDVQGKVVEDFTGEIQLALGDNPGAGTLLGTVTATAIRGIAHFEPVGIDRPGAGYTLVASAAGLRPATTTAIEIVAPRFTPVSVGLGGGRIAGIAASPAPSGGRTTVFASAGDGVYRSGDGGASWKPARFGGHLASRLIADPSQPGVVYSWSSRSLKKTMDGGGAWRELRQFPWAVALDPKNPLVIYVASSDLQRSTDGGLTWTDLDVRCFDVMVDAVLADTLYCSVFDQAAQHLVISRSSDGGETWNAIKRPGSSSYLQMIVATPTGIFVGTDEGLHRSTDAGDSWTRVSALFPYAMAYAPSMPDRLYLSNGTGISVSIDGGASFGAAVPTGDLTLDMAVDPVNPDVVYAAGSRSGVLVSLDGGRSWAPSSKGVGAHAIISVAVAPDAPDTLLTTTDRGTIRSTDGGMSWTTVTQAPVNVRFDPVVSTRAYLCGWSFFATSNDRGASFTGRHAAGLDSPCYGLLVAGTTLYATGSGRLLTSIDGGASWADTGLGPDLHVFSAALGDAAGKVVVVATPDGIHRSVDGGATFTKVTSDYTPSIVADPTVPMRIIGGQCPGLRRSSDGGASFGDTVGDACVYKLIGAGSSLHAVGAAQTGNVLLTSTDGGSTWTSVDITGIPGDRDVNITSIAASDDGSTVYLGTTAGLYKTAAR